LTVPTIAVIDYGAGNLHSVRRALEKADAEVLLTADPAKLADAHGVVLPGVGSAQAAMERLNALGFSDALREYAQTGRPLLGVCLGMQLFFGPNEEGPTHGLDLLPGSVVRMNRRSDLKIPHMGWNNLYATRDAPLLAGLGSQEYVYFVHSYQVLPERREDVAATTEYGGELVAVVARDNVMGTQFHPEKSGAVGLRMYAAFVEAARG